MDDSFQIFISYARPDQDFALKLYDWLKLEDLNPWMDLKNIKGGQNWDFEIKLALDKSSIILIIWSNNSMDRRGYVQRELKIALDKLQDKLIDDIFIIPILLQENLKIPEQLKDIHCLRESNVHFERELTDAITHQMKRLGTERQKLQKDQDLYWRPSSFKEEWEGTPGYAVEFEILEISSETYRFASQISTYITGYFLERLFSSRKNKLEQDQINYNYAQDKWSRTHTFDASCGEPHICGKVLTINYMISWYGAGAAHPVHGHKTFSFVLEPLCLIESLSSVFSDPEIAFPKIQEEVRLELKNAMATEEGDLDEYTVKAIIEGTDDWDSFQAFVFSRNSLNIYFSSYQVAPYAAGNPSVEIPYEKLLDLMKSEYVSALSISRFRL